jgi:hypothetical protein
VDRAALRVEIIRVSLESSTRMMELHARRHVAVLAVALASAITAGLSAFAAREAALQLLSGAAGLVLLAISQVRALGRLAFLHSADVEEAIRDLRKVEALMKEEDEDDADGTPP